MNVELGGRAARLGLSLAVAFAVACFATTAAAQEGAPPLHAGRFVIEGDGAYSFTPSSISKVGVGGSLSYYLSDAFAIGTSGRYWVSGSLPPASPALWPLQQKWYSLDVDVTWVLLSTARFSPEPTTTSFDTYLVGGVGMIATRPVPVIDPTRTFDPQPKVDFVVGVGTRLFLTRSLAVSLEVKDAIYTDRVESPAPPSSMMPLVPTDEYGTSRLVNDIQVGVGISLWLPIF